MYNILLSASDAIRILLPSENKIHASLDCTLDHTILSNCTVQVDHHDGMCSHASNKVILAYQLHFLKVQTWPLNVVNATLSVSTFGTNGAPLFTFI